jgi:trigger factor
MVEENIMELRTRMGGHSHPEEVADKDVAQGDFVEIEPDGQLKEGGIQHKSAVAVDLIKDEKVKEQFLGLKSGGKLRFNPLKATGNATEAAHMLGITKEEAEGLDTDFEFTLDEITRHELAELNEEFYKSVFPEDDIKDEAGFREKLKSAIEKSLEKESDHYFLHLATDKIMDTTEIPLPDNFLKIWIKEGSEKELTDEQVDAEFEKFKKSIRWQLIESRLIEDHDLKVEDEEMRNVVKDYFNGQMYFSAQDEESEMRLNKVIDSVLANKDESGKIYDQVFEAKMLDLFKKIIKLDHEDIPYKDFVNLVSNHKH